MASVPSRLLPLLPLVIGGVLSTILMTSEAGISAFSGILTVELLLPLVGVAIVLGQLPRQVLPIALVAFLAGAAFGLCFREMVYGLMAPIRGAAPHLFLTGPIACLATGAILILPPQSRRWIALPLLGLAGAALAIATRLSDPALFAPAYLEAAFALHLMLLLAVAWPVARFAHPALHTASRIFGSWMIAVALLYGAAFVAARDPSLTPPPFPPLPTETSAPGQSPVLSAPPEKTP